MAPKSNSVQTTASALEPAAQGVDGISYRHVAERDWPAVLTLRRQMVREIDDLDVDERYPGWGQRFERFYQERLTADQAAFFLAERGADPIGMGAVYALVNHRSEIFLQSSAYVSNVYVVPPLRRRGIALNLTRLAVTWARSRGCVVVRLRSSRMGRPLYVKAGFGPTEEMELHL